MRKGNTTLIALVVGTAIVVGSLLYFKQRLVHTESPLTVMQPKAKPTMSQVQAPAVDLSILQSAPGYASVSALIKSTNYVPATGSGEFTFFAASDSAFAKISSSAFKNLSQPTKTQNYLSYNTLPFQLELTASMSGRYLKSSTGRLVRITLRNGEWYLNNVAKIATPAAQVKSGLIYFVDRVVTQ